MVYILIHRGDQKKSHHSMSLFCKFFLDIFHSNIRDEPKRNKKLSRCVLKHGPILPWSRTLFSFFGGGGVVAALRSF